MTASLIAKRVGGFALLTLFHVIVVSLVGMMFGMNSGSPETGTEADATAFLQVVAMCGLNSAILMWLAAKSHLSGMKLGLWLSLIYIMVMPIMSMIESVFFQIGMDTTTTLKVILSQALGIVIVSMLVPSIMGRRKELAPTTIHFLPKQDTLTQTLAIGAVIYLMVYLLFGYFIAWQNEALRTFYGSSELLPFGEHMASLFTSDWHLVIFQLFRGVIWMGIASIIVSNISVEKLPSMLLVGATFAILMGSGLFVDNPFMPEEVRMIHLIEVLSSNLLYGVIAVWIWQRRS